LDSHQHAQVFRQADTGWSTAIAPSPPPYRRSIFSVNHGYFKLPFNLFLSTTTPARPILYTTDGSVAEHHRRHHQRDGYAARFYINKRRVRAAGFVPKFAAHAGRFAELLLCRGIISQPNNPQGTRRARLGPTPGFVQTGSQSYYPDEPGRRF